MLNWWWRRKAKRNARKAAAEAEERRSQELLDQTRRRIVRPLERAQEHNQFADMIRRALIDGEGGKQ